MPKIFFLLFLSQGSLLSQNSGIEASPTLDSLVNALNENNKVSQHQGPDAQQVYLSDTIHKHPFAKEEWKKAVNGLDYNETKDKPKEKKDKKKDNSFTYEPPSPSDAGWFSSSIAQTILIIFAALALALIIFKLFSGRISNTKIRKEDNFNIENIAESIHESDLEKFLREAIEKREFRHAVRIYYLIVIKELSLKSWIDWKKDKTNNQYLFEMSQRPNFSLFRDITRLFEYTWYGEMTINEEYFRILDPKFRGFLEELKNTQG